MKLLFSSNDAREHFLHDIKVVQHYFVSPGKLRVVLVSHTSNVKTFSNLKVFFRLLKKKEIF